MTEKGKNTPKECSCRASRRLEEVLEINRAWDVEYRSLKEKHESLSIKYTNIKKAASKEDITLDSGRKDRKLQNESEENIEVLKQQLLLYKEDFNQEHRENEELRERNHVFRLKIQELNRTVAKLEGKKVYYKQNFIRAQNDKMIIIDQLKQLSTESPSMM